MIYRKHIHYCVQARVMLLLRFVYLISVCRVSCGLTSDKRQEHTYTVNTLFHKLQDMQIQTSTESNSPFIPTQYEGLYESEWNLNSWADQSTLFKVKDNDMFSNSWIPIILLESYVYGRAPKPSVKQMKLSVDSIPHFRYGNISNPRMTIWPHKYYTTSKKWISGPVNLMRLMRVIRCLNWEQLTRDLDVCDIQFKRRRLPFREESFHVPPDYGSTFMNIGLGSVLLSMEQYFVGGYDIWASHFDDFTSVVTSLKYHAYRPFSSGEQNTNVIDAKSYLVLRKFLELAKENRNDVLLIPMWMFGNGRLDSETVLTTRHMKTIDVTTSAQALFGITSMIVTGMVSYDVLDDPDIEKIYRNTSSMLTFQIRTNFSGHSEIALQQYPSEFQFYWTVARTLSVLRRYIRRHGLFHQALVAVMLELKEVLQGPCTTRLMSAATRVGHDQVYFQEYTTNTATRLFTTSMSMNTLLYSWTVFDEGSGNLVWEEHTPADVRVIMERSAKWLNRHILGEKYRPGNEFLTWQRPAAHRNTFPANVCLHVNGTLSPITHFCDDPLNAGVKGVVSAEWYKSQLRGKTTEQGNEKNEPTTGGWSSNALTYGSAMLALSCHQNSVDYDVAYRTP